METINLFIAYLSKYGMYYLFVIVYLEYLNLPGLPTGIAMPAGGILVARNELNFVMVFVLSIVAGLLGSYTLYVIGYYLGKPALDKCYNKYKKIRPPIDKIMSYIDKYGDKGVFVSRLIPVARTLVSLVGGIAQMKLIPFTVYSVLGIAGWNLAFILAGYLMGKMI